jgi:hypothetical protein
MVNFLAVNQGQRRKAGHPSFTMVFVVF